ncbi:MAG: hypothetical protein J5644_03980 [Bacteroidales bacterium]|nr:hypothetical protein [Bacteroidales bacterium]
MKQRHLPVLLVLLVFLVYSSGLVITVHHCCHAHHHSANDHRHCTENTYIFKITDQYENNAQSVKKCQHLPEFVSDFDPTKNIPVLQHPHERCVEHCHCLFHAVHRCIFDMVSQLIL